MKTQANPMRFRNAMQNCREVRRAYLATALKPRLSPMWGEKTYRGESKGTTVLKAAVARKLYFNSFRTAYSYSLKEAASSLFSSDVCNVPRVIKLYCSPFRKLCPW